MYFKDFPALDSILKQYPCYLVTYYFIYPQFIWSLCLFRAVHKMYFYSALQTSINKFYLLRIPCVLREKIGERVESEL